MQLRVWNWPSWPVMPCTTNFVFLLTKTLIIYSSMGISY
jgi:hypothetical protein